MSKTFQAMRPAAEVGSDWNTEKDSYVSFSFRLVTLGF